MRVIQAGQTGTKDDVNPIGLFGYQPKGGDGGGVFVDLDSLSYRLLDPSGTEVQASTVVDVDRTSATTDAVLSVAQGLYAPDIVVPLAGPVGTWSIEWTFVVDGGASQTAISKFRVIDAGQPLVDGYAQVQDLRDEGVPVTTTYTDARLARALEIASRQFEEWTGRIFYPSLVTVDVDGKGGPIKQFDLPIIGLAGIAFSFSTFSPADLPISEGDIRVYNRHIRNNYREPDDRENPRMEFLRVDMWRYPRQTFYGDYDYLSGTTRWPESQQNISISGLFGYTDWDNTPFGKTPDLVQEAVMRMAMTKIQPLWAATGGGAGTSAAGPILMEKTMDQQVRYADVASTGSSSAYTGAFTGDPAIDQIILTYRRPARMASV